MLSKTLSLLALSAPWVEGCARDHLLRRSYNLDNALAKRQVEFPPVLTEHESVLANSFDNNTVSDWSYYYTHGLHVAGTNKSMAEWTRDRWTEHGVPAHLAEYYVYLNYPVSHSLSLKTPDGETWDASLEEAVLEEDETTSYPNRVPTFHGYSASGEAEAQFVYVGRGQQVDFDRLVELGVELEGKIAISRYGGPFRGLKVKNAQDHGMIGAILFTDPADDGNVTEANGYEAYPDGPARHRSSVQRGSVQFLSTYPGDPTTPGYPSKEDSPREDKTPVTPQIPSIPISWEEAVPILTALDGHGTPGEEVDRPNWVGGLDATYSTGPSEATISMSNEMKDVIRPIYNPVGIINGTSEDEVIVIGNHWDAWLIGGAADPNSGSAVLVELSKAFGKLQKAGWKPKRTIVMCSWDGEEYGLLGSTEWLEEYIPWLNATNVAYLNIDVAVSGPIPNASATPQLHKIAQDVMKKVVYPIDGVKNQTLYDVWHAASEGEFGVLGSGSDYTAFVHNGIASMDMGTGGGPDDAVYQYHSNFDSYHWMKTYGDPGFLTHVAMGQYLGLLAYRLATDELIPFEVNNYGVQMDVYLDELKTVIKESEVSDLDITALEDAIKTMKEAASSATDMIEHAHGSDDQELLTSINAKLRDFERGFVSQGGLPDREFYKHVVFAPGLDTGYAPTTFPGVTEAVEAGDKETAEEWVKKTARAIEAAAKILDE